MARLMALWGSIVVLMMPTASFAANWVYIRGSEGVFGGTCVDQDTIRAGSDGYAYYTEANCDDQNTVATDSATTAAINCGQDFSGQFQTYSDDDGTWKSYSWEPDSAEAPIAHFVCGR